MLIKYFVLYILSGVRGIEIKSKDQKSELNSKCQINKFGKSSFLLEWHLMVGVVTKL
jgi:hypothetical protein